MLRTRRVQVGLALLALLLAVGPAPAASARAPNIVFIMADDLGHGDLGVTNARQRNTPNIDQLAAEGLHLTNGYANAAICSPTRTALLTGNYQYRVRTGLQEPIGAQLAEADTLPQGLPTLASVFAERGYATSLIGKWHLGDPPRYGPLQYGYQHFFGIPKGAADYFRHRVNLAGEEPTDGLFAGDRRVERAGYLTTLFSDEAVRIIEASQPDRPFFLSVHYNAPHWPWEGPEDQAVSAQLRDIFHWDGGDLGTYGAMLAAMDHGVGRIMTALKAKGIDSNTIVVFTSDNGGERYSDNWPFSGVKGELLEGGIRTPIIVRWPGHIAAGGRSAQVMLSMDFMPTLLAATGRPYDGAALDGMNLLPVLRGAQPPVARTVYWRFKAGDQAAVRQGDWKYLRVGGKEHLFDVARDPRERAELKARHPEKFAELRQLWEEWNRQMLPYPQDSLSESVKLRYPDRY